MIPRPIVCPRCSVGEGILVCTAYAFTRYRCKACKRTWLRSRELLYSDMLSRPAETREEAGERAMDREDDT